jgi:ribosomal protein L37AE/L43A
LGGGTGVVTVHALDRLTSPAPGTIHGAAGLVNVSVALVGAALYGLRGGRLDMTVGPRLRIGGVLLGRRLDEKAPGRVEKVPAAYTSQRCSACGHVARENRESQAVFRCTACSFACNADVNAAMNIAAGHAVKARGGDRDTGPVNREPQLLAPQASS